MAERINKILFIGILFFCSSFALAEEGNIPEHTIDFKKLYDRMHADLKSGNKALQQVAQEYVGGPLGVSAAQVQQMLQEDPLKCGNNCLLAQYCPKKESLHTLQECKQKLESEVSRRTTQLQKEKEMHDESLAAQAFVNGTLQDTGNKAYDLIVDLNILDVLFFGDKASVPTNGSPFLPKNDSPLSGEPKASPSPTPTPVGFSPSASPSISPSPTTSVSPSPSPTPSFGFCLLPGDTIPSPNPYPSASSLVSPSVSPTPSGNYGNDLVDKKYKFQGGSYPDLSKFKKKKKCDAGEKSYFYGRICIPEFCNELICIKIDLKVQTKPKNTLSALNCTECHIERGNVALDKMMGTLGQNTPNVNPMEPYFLRAIANLFKNITSRITILSKPLPFLVYDEALIADKEESAKPEDQKEKEKDEKMKKDIKSKNRDLYTQVSLSCPEAAEHFGTSSVSIETLTAYCQKVDQERLDLKIDQQMQSEVTQSKHEAIATQYDKVLKPFEQQMANKIITINELLQSITPAEIEKTRRNCKTTINQ